MSEREACTLAKAFWEEVVNLPGADQVASAGFFQLASRLSETRLECELSSHFPKMGLAAGIPMSHVDVGLGAPHPILKISDFISTLDAHGKLDFLLMGNRSKDFNQFWTRWQQLQPTRPIFLNADDSKLDWSIPIAIHCDEGTGQKKRPLMIIQYQSILGRGTRKRQRNSEPGVNYLGVSIGTRNLYSVMVGRHKPLLALFAHLGEDLASAMNGGFNVRLDGIDRTIWLVPVAMKGDWPALTKVASMARHHGRDTPTKDDGAGICHLCLGGQRNQPWHDVRHTNMKKLRQGAPLPWKKTPSLLKPLRIPEELQAQFFRVDLFHTCHKGVMADIAANCIASCFCFV